jgi:hypothetical protein
MVFFDGIGFVPTATDQDDAIVFISRPPNKIGDKAIVYVEGRRLSVTLLRSSGMKKNSLWLVHCGV